MRAAQLAGYILVVVNVVPRVAGGQKLFEGSVRYDVVVDGKPSQFVITARNAKVRQDTSVPDSDGVVTTPYEVFDFQHGTITTISPSTKRFTRGAIGSFRTSIGDPRSISDLRALERARLEDIEATGHRESVLGLRCEIYVLKSTPGAEWCITSELGHFLAFEGQQGQLPAGTTAAFQGDDRLPRTTTIKFRNGAAVLRMKMVAADGRQITMIATKIDHWSPSMDFFGVPPGFVEANSLLPSP
ncbi:MAG TPA: DUF4412 domain-containing protein [Gemmatimonadaceae bacterium]|nr:DUF4412 domain-containing protein [Gemmatimonadaceae bacterium]